MRWSGICAIKLELDADIEKWLQKREHKELLFNLHIQFKKSNKGTIVYKNRIVLQDNRFFYPFSKKCIVSFPAIHYSCLDPIIETGGIHLS